MSELIVEGPIEWDKLSDNLKNKFTLSGRIPVRDWYICEKGPNKVGNLWSKNQLVNGIFRACRRGDLAGIRSYDARSVFDLYKAFDKYPIAYKDVLVIGSQAPWIEVACLAFGAKTVTTVDYNPPISQYEEIRTVGVPQFEKEEYKYDAIFSFSSLEHDGLGRYGDPIDPDGDIKSMNSYLDIIKPNGLFYFGVPNGTDTLYWNAHRIYGEVRFPMLTKNWDIVDFFYEGIEREQVFHLNPDGIHQPWWVLKPVSLELRT